MNGTVRILSVGEAISRMQWLLEGDEVLSNLWVRGEVSNFRAAGGHWYFALKDTSASLRSLMFRSRTSRVGFLPQNGLRVVAKGYMSVYERDGSLTFYLDELYADGVGALWMAFQQLKERLEAEGLFSPAHKRTLPFLPRVVGIVTSPAGAAFQDLRTIIHRRCPITRILLAPSAVQGPQAPAGIAAGIELLNRNPSVEVIIVGRGGGSLEELWALNTEVVARAIRGSRVPVISAVGHETDITIADLAADVRAATPSAAAEMVVPVLAELQRRLDEGKNRLITAYQQHWRDKLKRLESLSSRPVLLSPRGFLELRRRLLKQLSVQMVSAGKRWIRHKRERLNSATAQLDALSPLAVLSRGYAVCCRLPQREILFSSAQAAPGDLVEVRLAQGELLCQVEEAIIK